MTARADYESLSTARFVYEDRAEALSSLTIPSLFRDPTSDGFDPLAEPYQSDGAQGVLNLAAKFMLSIVPVGGRFAQLEVNRFELERSLASAGIPVDRARNVQTEVEENLVIVANEAHAFLDTAAGLRPAAFEYFQHQIVVGNGLFEINDRVVHGRPELEFTHHSLHDYVVERDRSGRPTLLVLKESLPRALAPEKALFLFMEDQEEVDLYTRVELEGPGVWTVIQEINDNPVPGTTGRLTPETNPFIIGRFIPASKENYGRSWCEHLYGALRSLEGMSQALVEGAAAAAILRPFLDPNSGISARRIAEAGNGEIMTGRGDALTYTTVGKQADFAFVLSMQERLSREIGRAFLRTSSVQRDGERVTAAEIQAMVSELQQAFGGIYSTIAEEFQRPLFTRTLAVMQKHRMIPKLPKDLVRVGIVTGLGDLGRGKDLDDLARGIGSIGQLLGPSAVAQLLDQREGAARIMNATGIDTRGFLKTREQLVAEQQAAQQAQALQNTAPELVRQGGQIARDQLSQ